MKSKHQLWNSAADNIADEEAMQGEVYYSGPISGEFAHDHEHPEANTDQAPEATAASVRLVNNPMLTAAYAAVLLFCATYFFRPLDFIPALAGVPLGKIIGAVAGAAIVATSLSPNVRFPKEAKIMLALFGYMLLGIPFSTWPGGSFQIIVMEYSKWILISIAAMLCVTNAKRLRRLLVVQTIAMLFLGFMGFEQERFLGRMYGAGNMFTDPNDLALNLCVVLPFAVAMLLYRRGLGAKIFWMAAIGLILVFIVATQSRGGFLALLAVLVAIWFRFRSRASASMMLVATLLLGIVVVVGGATYLTRMTTIVDTQADATGSAEARRELLIASLTTTAKHPLFGVGPDQFQDYSKMWHVTHNTYTELSSEAGVPALIIFLVLLRMTFRNLKAATQGPSNSLEWHLGGALYCSMVGYGVGAFFLSTAYLLLPYLLVAYAVAASKISTQTLPSPSAPASLPAEASV